MWPWEHLAVGYLAYSLLARVRTGQPPDGPATLTLAVATQLPDLIDKPLAWTFAVYPGGYSIGHSIFVAGVLSTLAVVGSRRIGRPALGLAFAVGYLSHLPADLLYLYLTSGYLTPQILLWPAVPPVGTSMDGGLLAHVLAYLRSYGDQLASGRLVRLFLLEVALVGAGLAAWLYDGRPGVANLRRRLARYT